MNKLLKDAIADAKTVRETALAQAKIVLEEAFAPKLQSMLSTKIKEEMDDQTAGEEDQESLRMKELAGLSERGDDDDMGGDDFSGGSDDFSSEEGGEGEAGGGEDNFSSEEGGEGGEDDFSSDDDDDLAEILRQLEEEEAEDPTMDDESIAADLDPNKDNSQQGDPSMEEEVNLDELIASLQEGEESDDDDESGKEEVAEVAGDEEYKKAPDQAMDTAKGSHGTVVAERKRMQKELNEAYTAVKYLREKLSEVNLLNAKLLYVNKLFRKSGLSEGQKVKIIETFDRAKNVREAKLIYATLSEAVSAPKTKKPVVENFASAPVKKTTKVIAEGNEQATRFKQLAGIINS